MSNMNKRYISKANITSIINKIETKLRNRYTKTEIDSMIASAISGVTQFDYLVVQELPLEGRKGVIYLIANNGSELNLYDEYIWIIISGVGKFEKLGPRKLDISNKLENSDIKVSSSLTKTNDVSGNGLTLDVNVDGTSIVKDSSTGALKINISHFTSAQLATLEAIFSNS